MASVNIDVDSLSPKLQAGYDYLEKNLWRKANDSFDLVIKDRTNDVYAYLGKAMAAEFLSTPAELEFAEPTLLSQTFFLAALQYAEGSLKDELTHLVVDLNLKKQKEETAKTEHPSEQDAAAKPMQKKASKQKGEKSSQKKVAKQQQKTQKQPEISDPEQDKTDDKPDNTAADGELPSNGNSNWDIEEFEKKAEEKKNKKSKKKKAAKNSANSAESSSDDDAESTPAQPDTEVQAQDENGTEPLPESTNGDEVFDVVEPTEKKGKGKKKFAVIIAVIAVIAAVCGAVTANTGLFTDMDYKKAMSLIENNDFDKGLEILENSCSIDTSSDEYKDILYKKALYLLENGDTEQSKSIFLTLGNYKESVKQIADIEDTLLAKELRAVATTKKGSTVDFGHYETDGNEENGDEPISWIVLDRKDNLVTLISEQSLAASQFNSADGETDWARSSLRKWLNNSFYKSAFSEKERAHIEKSSITNPVNPDYPSKAAAKTSDYVYLMSISEAKFYFADDTDRQAVCTDASYNNTYTDKSGRCTWWLRTSGAKLTSAIGVDSSGVIMTVGYDCDKNAEIGVRPMIVVNTAN